MEGTVLRLSHDEAVTLFEGLAGWPLEAGPAQVCARPKEETTMTPIRIAGIALIVLGLVGFFTGGFSFTKETTQAQLGPLKIQVQEKESVNVPQWLSVGAIVLGGVLLAFGLSRK